eukprot:GHRQ01025990.1.p2 GENE.GHRQ01025990.1~~GHRQ01025990.1.p2  ORF type:complete len:122 (+),score=22.20 GHRQ01025990.1:462-827(+)
MPGADKQQQAPTQSSTVPKPTAVPPKLHDGNSEAMLIGSSLQPKTNQQPQHARALPHASPVYDGRPQPCQVAHYRQQLLCNAHDLRLVCAPATGHHLRQRLALDHLLQAVQHRQHSGSTAA